MADDTRYGIEELASLGGVTRRTVRFYVQEGLLPAPEGLGRGRHYGPAHLSRLVAVRSMQERGMALPEIRRALDSGGEATAGEATAPPWPAREAWVRLTLLPGVELHVATGVRLPSPARLADLAKPCRRLFSPEEER